MKNKTQEGRIRQYFIDAAMEIIRGEGLVALNVRNVAEKAGFSYATLYNYFDDLKSLLNICIQSFQNECLDYIQSNISVREDDNKYLLSILNNFTNYFVQYPGIFTLLFLENKIMVTKSPFEKDLFSIITEKFDLKISEEKANLIYNFTVGSLLNYMNRNNVSDYKHFIIKLNSGLDKLLSVN